MKTFHFMIVTPDRIMFDGEVQEVIARTTEGDVGILAGHIRYAAILQTGALKIKLENGDERLAAVAGGIIKVSDTRTTVMSTAAEWAEEIDPDWAERSRQDALTKIAAAQNEPDRLERANLKLMRALNRLSVSGHNTGTLGTTKKK